VKVNERDDGMERRQLDFIQRVGRIGYWEFDPAERAMSLPEPSWDLLASIIGGSLNAHRSFMDVLCDTERRRFQIALDQAIAERLALNIELQLASGGSQQPYIAVRGARIERGQGPPRFAGTFQDITNEKHREADHEAVITQLQALLDALPQGVSVIDKDLRIILWNQRFHEILGFPKNMVFRHARFEDFIRLNAMRGDYGPGDPEEQVQAIVARAREFVPHRFERQLAGGRTVKVEGFPFTSGGDISGFVTTYTDITDQKRAEEELTRQRDVMKTVIDNFPGGISLCDAGLRFTTYNDQFMELLDFPPSLFAKGWVHFEDLARFNVNRGEYGPGDPEEQVRAIVTRARNFQAHRIERARPNGRWLEIRGTPLASGGFVTSYIDITERKRAEKALAESEERWKFALEGANDGVWDWNFETGEVLYSKRWKEMFGFSETEIGNTTTEWLDRVHPDDLTDVGTAIKLHLFGKTSPPSVEYRFRCKNGSWKWTLGRGMVVSRNSEGKPLRLVGTNSDITERKRMEEEVRQLALYDPLTKLPNRRLLNEHLSQAMSVSKRSALFGAVMVLDLDNFKALNDTHGHLVGDVLLVDVAARLNSCLREMDTVARLGGDEFVVVLSELHSDRAESLSKAGIIAEKIRASLSEPYLLSSGQGGRADGLVTHHCTTSIGVALFIGNEASQDDVLKWADAAMYQAKNAGRNSFFAFDSTA
jgi:diguanylate cyclase (GGDEF)-like protein/PAS domain S-box-containing protein